MPLCKKVCDGLAGRRAPSPPPVPFVLESSSVIALADSLMCSRDVGGLNVGFMPVRCSIIDSISDMNEAQSEGLKMLIVVTLLGYEGGMGWDGMKIRDSTVGLFPKAVRGQV